MKGIRGIPSESLSRRALLALAGGALAGMLAADLPDAMAQADPLPSWNDGPARQAILDFLGSTARISSPDFVPQHERIAVLDNDGTLWAEQPVNVQAQFAFDRIRELAPQHPEWQERQPFKAVIEGDRAALSATGQRGLVEILAATHAGMTADAFDWIVADWLAKACHPRFNRPYPEMVYQPMLELLGLLRGNGFKTYIVSGGGVEFIRGFVERAYGIPPEQVIGSPVVTRFELRPDGTPALMREPKVLFVDDGPGKPEAIDRVIGRVPILAFGNSDGDLQMLQYTAVGRGARFMGLVHHTDAEREWAYDRESRVGRLDKALDEAGQRGWTVVDMKRDWRTVFPPQRAPGRCSEGRRQRRP
jgi:phosphoglycolate phosphatase-like HAD superfamily hydrolase